MSYEIPVVYFNEDPRLPELLLPYSFTSWIDHREGADPTVAKDFRAVLRLSETGTFYVPCLFRRGPYVQGACVLTPNINTPCSFRSQTFYVDSDFFKLWGKDLVDPEDGFRGMMIDAGIGSNMSPKTRQELDPIAQFSLGQLEMSANKDIVDLPKSRFTE